MNAIQLIKDIQTMIIGDLRDKYQGKVKNITITEIIEALKATPEGLEQLIGVWKDDQSDRGGSYLIRNQNQFEVFNKGDRGGGKEWLHIYSHLEDAAFDYIDRYFSELHYTAPDARRNR